MMCNHMIRNSQCSCHSSLRMLHMILIHTTGGSVLSLKSLFTSLDTAERVFQVPIFNSFFAIPPPPELAATMKCDPVKGMPLVTVEFRGSRTNQGMGMGMISRDQSFVSYSQQFSRMAHLFKPSQLPTREQAYIVSHMMPGTSLRRA